MALTADQIADAFNKNGVDSPEKFQAFIDRASASLEVTTIQAQINQVRADRDAHNQEVETQLQALQQALVEAEQRRDGLG
jgi:uncharacterized protein YpuA (DUF1002 family)